MKKTKSTFKIVKLYFTPYWIKYNTIHLTSNPKNKGTLFSSIFKVREHKVSLFLGLEVKWMGYGYF